MFTAGCSDSWKKVEAAVKVQSWMEPNLYVLFSTRSDSQFEMIVNQAML